MKTALVLSGGGARGAYQAGVLAGLVECGLMGRGQLPFPILVGNSAGAINAAALAAHAETVQDGIAELTAVWGNLRPHRVFRTDPLTLIKNALRWMRDLSLGGLLGHVGSRSLLDTEPLGRLLARIPLERIPGHVLSGRLRALAVGATNYQTGNGVLFLEGQPDLPLWERPRHRVERTSLGVQHLLASSSIPLFFPPVAIEGRYFGDGCVRNSNPLSPAIQLGADRVLAIGVRQPYPQPEFSQQQQAPSVAQVVGILLDAVMLDALETDTDHSERINRQVAASGGNREPFRQVAVLCLNPSQSLSALAAGLMYRLPPVVRYLLRGLGGDESSAELASYLLFDAAFTDRLLELGRRDVRSQQDKIGAFLA